MWLPLYVEAAQLNAAMSWCLIMIKRSEGKRNRSQCGVARQNVVSLTKTSSTIVHRGVKAHLFSFYMHKSKAYIMWYCGVYSLSMLEALRKNALKWSATLLSILPECLFLLFSFLIENSFVDDKLHLGHSFKKIGRGKISWRTLLRL